jgi:hypothetical protein
MRVLKNAYAETRQQLVSVYIKQGILLKGDL